MFLTELCVTLPMVVCICNVSGASPQHSFTCLIALFCFGKDSANATFGRIISLLVQTKFTLFPCMGLHHLLRRIISISFALFTHFIAFAKFNFPFQLVHAPVCVPRVCFAWVHFIAGLYFPSATQSLIESTFFHFLARRALYPRLYRP